jgi:hypothetical protein
LDVLETAVLDSGRWKKWLQPGEGGLDFKALSPARQSWLLQTGSRYVWTNPAVRAARQQLYTNLSPILPDPHAYVVDRIVRVMDHYVNAFGLFDALSKL